MPDLPSVTTSVAVRRVAFRESVPKLAKVPAAIEVLRKSRRVNGLIKTSAPGPRSQRFAAMVSRLWMLSVGRWIDRPNLNLVSMVRFLRRSVNHSNQ